MPIDFIHMNGDSFENMCASVCHEEFGAVRIEANPGDGGIDSFRGSLLDSVEHVWQYKHFPEGIGKSQKPQIRKSLQTVIANYHPKQWTLVVPCDLDQGAQKWFEKQIQDFVKDDVELHYIGGTALRNLLLKHQSIRQFYFPSTDDHLKTLVAAVGGKSELLRKPKANVLDLIQSGVEYINSDSPDWGFRVSADEQGRTVEAFLRNPNAEDKTAAQFELAMPNNAAGKKVRQSWVEMHTKGTPFVVDGRHVTIKKSVFDGLVSSDFTLSQMQMIPHVPDRRLPMSLTFTAASGASATLPFIDLRLKREGSKEMLFTNEAQGYVLIVSLTAGSSNGGLKFRTRNYVGRKTTEVATCEDALAVVAEGLAKGEVRVDMTHIESGLHAGAAILSEVNGEFDTDRHMRLFYDSLAVIERNLDPSLRVPKSYYDRDIPAAARLAKILTDGELKAQGSAKLTLTVSNAAGARESIANNEPATLLLDESTEEVKLLGKTYVFDTITSVTAPLVLLDKTPDDLVDGSAFAVRQEGDITRKYTNGRLAPETSE